MITQFPQSPISSCIFYMILPHDVILSMLKSYSLWYFIHLIFIPFILFPTLHLVLFHMLSLALHYFLYSHMITHLICSWESHQRTFYSFLLFNKKRMLFKIREWACHSLETSLGRLCELRWLERSFWCFGSSNL